MRHQSAKCPEQQVDLGFAGVAIDEAGWIPIDEARIPLVLAGGESGDSALVYRVDQVTRHLRRGVDYVLDKYGRSASLTDAGIHALERAFGCKTLFSEVTLRLVQAIQDSLHAH